MRNNTELTMTYPNLQRPDGSTVVLAPGEEFDESTPEASDPGAAPSAAAGPADETPSAEPAAATPPETPVK